MTWSALPNVPSSRREAPTTPFISTFPADDTSSGIDQYENAARTFHNWLDHGVVLQDEVPGFYIYRMTFHDERGHRRMMTGLLGALGLDLDGTGEVMPHEQTMAKDRLDRLSLLRSTRLNTSPIWGLSLAKGLTSACQEAIFQGGESSFRATDDAGVVHELWPVTDEDAVDEITRALAQARRFSRRRPPPLSDRLHLRDRMPGEEQRC